MKVDYRGFEDSRGQGTKKDFSSLLLLNPGTLDP